MWFRNYQVARVQEGKSESTELYEIGPRMVLNPVCIQTGCMSGAILYQNPNYESSGKVCFLI